MPKVKGNYCNVEGCHNRSEDDKIQDIERHYYRLPAVIYHQGKDCERLNSERRRLWLAQLDQDFTGKNLANVRVCSDHFINKKKADLYQRDSPDWIPTVNMTSKSRLTDDIRSPAINDRYTRIIERQKKCEAAKTLMELSALDNSLNAEAGEPDVDTVNGIAVQTDIEQPLAMQNELQTLRTENIDLKAQLITMTSRHNISEFRDSDEKVKYFTGLPKFSVLMALFDYVQPKLPVKQCVDQFQFLMLSLMRLRLNLPMQFLYPCNFEGTSGKR